MQLTVLVVDSDPTEALTTKTLPVSESHGATWLWRNVYEQSFCCRMSAQPIEVKESSRMVPEQCSSEIGETGSAAGSALEQSIGTVTAISSQCHETESVRPDVTRNRTVFEASQS